MGKLLRCGKCQKTFTGERFFNIHQRLFVCSKASRRLLCQKPILLEDYVGLSQPVSQSVYACNFCGCIFDSESRLKLHVINCLKGANGDVLPDDDVASEANGVVDNCKSSPTADPPDGVIDVKLCIDELISYVCDELSFYHCVETSGPENVEKLNDVSIGQSTVLGDQVVSLCESVTLEQPAETSCIPDNKSESDSGEIIHQEETVNKSSNFSNEPTVCESKSDELFAVNGDSENESCEVVSDVSSNKDGEKTAERFNGDGSVIALKFIRFAPEQESETDGPNNGTPKPYKCEICNETFSARFYLIAHGVTHSVNSSVCVIKTDENFETSADCGTCEICKQSSSCRCNLTPRKSCVVLQRFKCDICQNAYRSEFSLQAHRKNCCFERRTKNEFCHIDLSHKTSIRNKTEDKPYKCKICAESFSTEFVLFVHVNSHKLHIDIHDEAHVQSSHDSTCSIQSVHKEVTRRNRHVRQMVNCKVHFRPKSPKREVNQKALETTKPRFKKSEINRLYQCRACLKVYTMKCNLYRHQKTNCVGFKYNCSSCHKKFMDRSSLMVHKTRKCLGGKKLKVGSKGSRLKCKAGPRRAFVNCQAAPGKPQHKHKVHKKCPFHVKKKKKNTEPNELKKTRKSYMEISKYDTHLKCSGCEKRCSTKATLQWHENYICHSGKLKCCFCNVEVGNRHSLLCHKKKCSKNPLKCDQCSRSFSKVSSFERHKRHRCRGKLS